MTRVRVAALVALALIGMSGNAQEAANSKQKIAAAVANSGPNPVEKPESLRVIAMYEDVARRADAQHFSEKSLVKIYVQLGGMYFDTGMFPKAEDAMQRAISLLRQYGPQEQLAEEIGYLADLHIATGNVHLAEKEHMEALKIRESTGDPIGIALTWTDLAALYVKQGQYKKAAYFGQRAFAVIGDNPKVSPNLRLAVRQNLGRALCETHDAARAIPILKDAVALAQTSFGAESAPSGIASYLLGYAYWRSGNMVNAATWMEAGTVRMNLDIGRGHPMYVQAMENYARFLRARGQNEAAAVTEREVQRAKAVVDVRTLTARGIAMDRREPR